MKIYNQNNYFIYQLHTCVIQQFILYIERIQTRYLSEADGFNRIILEEFEPPIVLFEAPNLCLRIPVDDVAILFS